MNKIIDFVESCARYLKARHVGELTLFVFSVLLLTWTVAITLINDRNLQTLSTLENNVLYFVQWLIAVVAHAFITSVTLTVFFKHWGNRRIVLLCILFQGLSLLILFLFLPLK